MKNHLTPLIFISILSLLSCNSNQDIKSPDQQTDTNANAAGQASVVDEASDPNIVQVASSSKDHSTLVTAVKAAGLVDVLSTTGPFTVFGPTNAAFDKLPAGTLDDLLKRENQADLKNILEYHTYVGVLKTDYIQDGQSFEMVNGGKISITKKGDKIMINGKATISTSIPTSNGVIHVIDEVLLP
jgi:uncharacterized surface protein with fasciclin (FAS1) repeats